MELSNISGIIGIGTVTDPYQPVEAKYMLTRRCLEVLKANSFEIHLHTKSNLILRDIDLLSEMRGVVGFTVTSTSDRHSKVLEPGAPLPGARFSAMRSLVDAGVDTYALVGPVLNHLEGFEEEFVDTVVSTGVKRMYLDSLNRRPMLSERVSRRGYAGSPLALAKIKKLAKAAGLEVFDVF